jgi:hypothetical protein
MFFSNMFNKFINIALISTAKSTLKSTEEKKNFLSNKISYHTLYLDLIKEHHSIKVPVYSIGQHDYDVNAAKQSKDDLYLSKQQFFLFLL